MILKDPQGLVTHAENSTTSDTCLLEHPTPVGQSPPADYLHQGLWVGLLPSLTQVKVFPVSIYNSTKFISLPSARNVCVRVGKCMYNPEVLSSGLSLDDFFHLPQLS